MISKQIQQLTQFLEISLCLVNLFWTCTNIRKRNRLVCLIDFLLAKSHRRTTVRFKSKILLKNLLLV